MALTRRQRKLRSEVEEIASKICLDPWNIEQYEADARTTEAIELPIQDICAGAYRYRARDQSLVSMAVNDWKVCMTEDFSEAHRRLDRILRFFLVVCAAGWEYLGIGIRDAATVVGGFDRDCGWVVCRYVWHDADLYATKKVLTAFAVESRRSDVSQGRHYRIARNCIRKRRII